MAFQLPRNDEHTSIMGRNGTGKTQLAAWILSAKNNLNKSRNIILDYKNEVILNSIERTREIDHKKIPRQHGLYILHSRPDLVDEDEAFLWRVWETENTGLFIDEGYMVPSKGAYRAVLTQGRSKRIPIITLSQRPVEIDRFAFSEAAHIVLLDLDDQRDRETVGKFTPRGFTDWVPDGVETIDDEFEPGRVMLPDFHSRWYDRKRRKRFVLKPVPQADEIIASIDAQLEPKRRWF